MGGVGSRTGLSRGREVKVMPRGQFFGDDFPSPGTIFPHPPTPIVKRTYYLQYHRLFCTWSQPTRLKRCSPLLQPSLMRLTEFKKTFTPRTSLLFLSKVSCCPPLERHLACTPTKYIALLEIRNRVANSISPRICRLLPVLPDRIPTAWSSSSSGC